VTVVLLFKFQILGAEFILEFALSLEVMLKFVEHVLVVAFDLLLSALVLLLLQTYFVYLLVLLFN